MVHCRLGDFKWHSRNSVANSWQNFPASPAEKFGYWEKIRPIANFDWKALGLRNKNVCVSYGELEEKNKMLRDLASFLRTFLCKIGQISAADLPGRSTVFSTPFELCVRTTASWQHCRESAENYIISPWLWVFFSWWNLDGGGRGVIV